MGVQRAIRVLVGVLIATFLVAGVALAAAANPTIDWWVIGAGGGSESTSGTFLGVTVGQWVVGSDFIDTTHLDSGFWAGVIDGHTVYMPLILRQT